MMGEEILLLLVFQLVDLVGRQGEGPGALLAASILRLFRLGFIVIDGLFFYDYIFLAGSLEVLEAFLALSDALSLLERLGVRVSPLRVHLVD